MATASATASYTTEDVCKVVRRIRATLAMIADSTGGWTPEKTAEYAHDIEQLATRDYLKYVDVTLLNDGVEEVAARFTVNTAAGTLKDSRPGDGLWPKVAKPYLRIVLGYKASYTAAAKAVLAPKLKIGWIPSSADISHARLNGSAGRSHASNSYGVERTDWS